MSFEVCWVMCEGSPLLHCTPILSYKGNNSQHSFPFFLLFLYLNVNINTYIYINTHSFFVHNLLSTNAPFYSQFADTVYPYVIVLFIVSISNFPFMLLIWFPAISVLSYVVFFCFIDLFCNALLFAPASTTHV